MTKKKNKAELIATYKKANKDYKETLVRNNPKLKIWLRQIGIIPVSTIYEFMY